MTPRTVWTSSDFTRRQSCNLLPSLLIGSCGQQLSQITCSTAFLRVLVP